MPSIHAPASGFLVVEGFINAGSGQTHFLMSRSSGLDSIFFKPETGAELEVVSESGSVFPLADQGGGNYSVDQVPVDPAKKYRVHIKTRNGKEYLSDLVEVKISPQIDQVDWSADANAVSIFVSSHDDLNKTRYYQWAFEETWQYNSKYTSGYVYVNDTVRTRPASETLPYYCWRSDSSTSIVIASSAKLEKDVINEFPLTKIPYSTTNKLITRYSILVKQYALTKDWYEWKQKVKKNTEQLGSIFDAQPSETGGNIHCTSDPGEAVIGFVGCSTESVKRIFISHSDVPAATIFSGYESCSEQSKKNDPDSLRGAFLNNAAVITDIVGGPGPGGIDRVLLSQTSCVDCRMKGGTSTKPDFW
jgi:hypothetical protein